MEFDDISRQNLSAAPAAEVPDEFDIAIPASEAYEDDLDQAANERTATAPADHRVALDGAVVAVAENARAPRETRKVHAEADEVNEARPPIEYKHISVLAKVTKDNAEEVKNQPEPERVAAAIRNGENQRLVITREEVGGPTRFTATEPLVPSDAKAATSAHSAVDTGSKFTAWARIVSDRRVVTEVTVPGAKQAAPETPTGDNAGGLNIEGFLAQHKGAFQVVVSGEAVSREVNEDLISDVSTAMRTAAQTGSLQKQVPKLAAFQNELTTALDTGLVRREIVIGAENPAELHRLARVLASSGMTPGDVTTWSEVGKDRNFTVYPDAASAIAAGEKDPNSFISAERFAQEVKLPERPVAGLDMEHRETFAANRIIADGTRSVAVGEIIDNDDQPAGELRVSDKDLKRHGLIAASSGAGKTYLIRHIVSNIIKEDCERTNGEESAEPERAIVIVDFEKFGNYTDKLSEQLRGIGVPEDRARVHRICPGQDGLRANINLLRLTGTTPGEQVAVAVKALSGNMEDPQAVRVFTKFASAAIERAYEKLGWNMQTDRSRYPNDTPPIPDMDMVAVAVEEILSESTFRAETKGDLGSFTKTTLEDALRGIPGQLFQGGYDIDWTKVIKPGTLTVIELGRITDIDAKRVAMTGIFRGLAAALRADNPNGGDIDETKLTLVMDETGGIFDKHTETGRDNAHFFTNVRGLGMSVITAQQGSLESIHTDVLDNTGNLWAMQVNSPDDRRLIADRMGITVPKYLGNVNEGAGLYQGRDMPGGPVRFRTPHPDDIARVQGSVVSPDQLVDPGTDRTLYSGDVKVQARDLLLNEDLGNMIRGLAEINTALTITGHAVAEVKGRFKADLQAMSGVDAEIRDSAIATAVTQAVYSRPEIMHAMKHRDLIRYITEDILAQVHDQPRPTKGTFDLQFDFARYAAVEDRLTAATVAPRLKDTGDYNKALGLRVGGATAEEQLVKIEEFENNSVRTLSQAVTAGPQLNQTAVEAAAIEFRRLTGLMSPKDALEHVQAKLTESLDRPLERDELTALERVTDHHYRHSGDAVVGYPEMRDQLQRAVDMHRYCDAIDLTDMEELYAAEFGTGVHFGSGKAMHQRAEVDKLKNKVPQSYKVTLSKLLFAPDLMTGGTTLDNVLAFFVAGQQQQGAIYGAQRRLYNSGQEVNYSLVQTLKRGDKAAADAWGRELGHRLLMGPDLGINIPSTLFLRRWIGEHIGVLKQEDKRLRAQAATANPTTGAKA